jgi:hypothetical protein
MQSVMHASSQDWNWINFGEHALHMSAQDWDVTWSDFSFKNLAFLRRIFINSIATMSQKLYSAFPRLEHLNKADTS